MIQYSVSLWSHTVIFMTTEKYVNIGNTARHKACTHTHAPACTHTHTRMGKEGGGHRDKVNIYMLVIDLHNCFTNK